MELGLNESVIILLGAGPILGLAITEAFVSEGAIMCGASRNPENWRHSSQIVGTKGYFCTADGRDSASVRSFVSSVKDRFGTVHAAICNVGPVHAGDTWDLSPEDWAEACRDNVLPLWNLCQQVVPVMQEHGGGAIVNIGSVSGLQPGGISTPDHGFFKAGALNLVKRLASELAVHTIRVNTVTPGFITPPSPQFAEEVRVRMGAKTVEDALRRYASERVPMRRLATAREVAAAVVFLSSKAASYITGQNLVVDGGYLKGL